MRYYKFYRDPPEPTGDEPEDFEYEAPKIYEPVSVSRCLQFLRDNNIIIMYLVNYSDIQYTIIMYLVNYSDITVHTVTGSTVVYMNVYCTYRFQNTLSCKNA